VKITFDNLPSGSSLTNNGIAVVSGTSISYADLGGNLVFTPAVNFNGEGYMTLSFQVQDDGGTANEGVDLDPTPNTMTINVNSVNDAPLGEDKPITILEDAPYTFGAGDFGFSDNGDTPEDEFLAVKITNISGAGTLKNDGVLVSEGEVISVAVLSSSFAEIRPVPSTLTPRFAVVSEKDEVDFYRAKAS
jgi:hypothetical protein